MIIECPNCNKKFNLDKKLIPEKGRTLKCSSCNHIWYYKFEVTKDIDDIRISEDKNTKLDTNISEEEKKKEEQYEEVGEENLTDIDQGLLSKENSKDEVDRDKDIKDEKENEEKKGEIKLVFVYFIVVIISLLGIIFLLDTFKSYLSSVFPSINPLLDSFYETLLDFKLFIKDFIN
tara:strand:- start:109 stop:636 length:528 start_codon:yes stop_codon:yes gene_type:complete